MHGHGIAGLGMMHPQTQVSEANLAAVLNRRAGHGPPPA